MLIKVDTYISMAPVGYERTAGKFMTIATQITKRRTTPIHTLNTLRLCVLARNISLGASLNPFNVFSYPEPVHFRVLTPNHPQQIPYDQKNITC